MNDSTRPLVPTTAAVSKQEGTGSSTLIQQIIGLLKVVMEQEKQQVVPTGKRPRGRLLSLSWSHLWLVLLTRDASTNDPPEDDVAFSVRGIRWELSSSSCDV